MMKIPIELKADKVSEFLDYLRVEIESIGPNWHGEGSFNDDGQFVERVFWSVSKPGYEDSQIVLTVTWKTDGTLEPIVADVKGEAPDTWGSLVEETILRAVVATVNAKRERFFSRYAFAYIGPPLDGEYYIPGFMSKFRIAPAVYPDDEQAFNERILYIDLYTEGIDRPQAHLIGKVHAEQIAALLSVFLGVGIYSIPPLEHRWVYIDSENMHRKTCKRYRLGFISPTPPPSTMPKKGVECPLGCIRSVDRTSIADVAYERRLRCPSDIRDLFRCFYSLPSDERETYIGAASLYRIALTAGRYYPTVQMSYQVAAIDALVWVKEHNQATFDAFVQEYCPEAPSHFGAEIYGKIRSAHFHSGALPGGEHKAMKFGPFTGPDHLIRFNRPHLIHSITHTVLVRWLLNRRASKR